MSALTTAKVPATADHRRSRQSSTKVSYKTHLLEVREMMSNGRSNAFDVASRLLVVFHDERFREETGADDDFKAAELLDAEISDLCVNFLELNAMLTEFPDRQTWLETPLARLYEMTVERISARKAEENGEAGQEKRTRASVTRKQFEQVTAEKQDLQARLSYSERQMQENSKLLNDALDENRRLREELARANGRIEELERIISVRNAA